MSKESIRIKQKVQQLTNNRIKTLLLANLIQRTDKLPDLFTKQYPNERNTIPSREEIEEKHIINLVFQYAPTAMCDDLADLLLSINHTDFIHLFSGNRNQKINKLSLINLMDHASAYSRCKIAEKINLLPEDEIINLLFISPNLTLPDFTLFLKLAVKNDDKSVILLLKALTKINSKKLYSIFNELPKKNVKEGDNRWALECSWAGNRTVLHHAASQGYAVLVDIFLHLGFSDDLKDNKGCTAIDYAVANNHLETLKLFTFNLKLTTINTFANALNQASVPTKSYETLEEILKGPQLISVQDYCIKYNDCYIYFLTEIGRLFLQQKQSKSQIIRQNLTLENAIKLYFQTNLQKIQRSNPLQQNAIQLHLIILIASIPTLERITLLSLLALSQQDKTQLGLILTRSLIQPAIYLNLSAGDHQHHFQFLRELLPHDQTVLESIATIHLQGSNLSQFPAETLQEFAKITRKSLLIFIKQRICPILLVLTIEELLKDSPLDEINLSKLFKRLKQEIHLLNQDFSSQQVEVNLQFIANLATQSRLKGFILQLITQEIPDLSLRLNQMVISTHPISLVPDSLLFERVKEIAYGPELLIQPQNYGALYKLLATTAPENFAELVQHTQKNLAPFLVSASFLSAAAFEPQNKELNEWMGRLENKTRRLNLTSIIEQIDQIYNKTLQYDDLLMVYAGVPLRDCLKNIANKLHFISSHLFAVHIHQTDLAWSSELENSLLGFTTALEETPKVLPKEGSFLRSSHQQLLNELNQFVNSAELIGIRDKIDFICKELDKYQEQTNFNHTILSDRFQRPSSQPSKVNLPLTALEETKLLLIKLNQHVLQGILQNPQHTRLLTFVFNWIFSCGYAISSEVFYHHISQLVQTTNSNDWLEVDQQIEKIVSLRNDVSTLLLDLQVAIISSPVSLENLLTILYSVDESQLLNTIELCSLAQLHDFKSLVNYVLTAKNHDIQIELLCVNSDFKNNDVSSLIQHYLTAIDSYVNQAMSFKVLKAGIYHPPSSTIADIDAAVASFNAMLEQNIAVPYSKAIIELIATYVPMLKSKERSLEHRLFILTLHALFKHSRAMVIVDTINQLTPEMLELILSHCLLGLNGDDKLANDQRIYDEACRYLLNNLCTYVDPGTQAFNLIKEHLGHQDLDLLGDSKLIEIAKYILTDKQRNAENVTLNAIWIQRLLTDPRFIASLKSHSASPTKLLQQLSDRYHFYSMVLKEDEYKRLYQFFKSQLVFSEQHRARMENLRKEILASDTQKEHLLKKLESLLQFRAHDCLRALFNQLEANCNDLEKESPELATAAKNVLYTHYNNGIAGMQVEPLFKIADFIIGSISQGKTDLGQIRRTLVIWLKTFLPHKNFAQAELIRKQQVLLYDSKRRKIGFINEANYAMTLDNPPHPLLGRKGIVAGTRFYDDGRRLIGTLNTTGQIQHDNLFQKNTSALLIATVPQEKLEDSPETLSLLLTDIFTENSLEELYEKSDTSKHEWITSQVEQHLVKTSKPIQTESLCALLNHRHRDSFFPLLAKIKSLNNAEKLFELILTHAVIRKKLFKSGEQQTFIFEFFKRHESSLIFANFLSNHHDKPWLANGLQVFALYAEKNQLADLLIKALILLNERTFGQKILSEQSYNAVLITLLSSRACVSIIWRYFFAATASTDIQKINFDLAGSFSAFFFKHHCLPVIELLTQETDSTQTDQHRLLLLILANQRETLFRRKEIRFSSKIAWSKTELEQISIFIKQHFRQLSNCDRNLAIGKELLAELVFRCANFGLINLFYQNNAFDPQMATQTLNRSLLNAIAAKNYLPKELKEKINDLVSTVIGWFDDQYLENQQTIAQLSTHGAIIDWKELSNQAWKTNDSLTEMPLISAYLINYSGKYEPLVKLIKDYVTSSKIKQLNPISQVMVKLPRRDVSYCIFTTFEELITENNQYLSKDLFAHMAQFYIGRFPEKIKKGLSAEMNFIYYLGQQQKYPLVMQACKLLEVGKKHSSTKKLLRQINKEARVEFILSAHLNGWYYPFLQFFMRVFNYGLNVKNHITKFVTFCDQIPYHSIPAIRPVLITTPAKSGEEIEKEMEFAEKSSKLRERYNEYLRRERQKEVKKENIIKITAPSRYPTGYFKGMKSQSLQNVPELISNPGDSISI